MSLAFAVHGQSVHSFQNGSFKLYYEVFGQGPPLYVLSGGPGEPPGHPYYQIIDSLKRKYTCVFLHQRGVGRSRAIPMTRETVTIANYVQDLEMMRKSRGDQRVTVVGYSWGGLYAMSYTAAHPESVANLVLLASAPASYRHWNALFGNQFVRRSQVEVDSMALLQKIFSPRSSKELDSMKRTNPSAPEVVAFKHFIGIHIRAMHYRKDNVYAHYDALFNNFNFQPTPLLDEEVLGTKMDLTPKLKTLKTPALILYGRQDDQGESVFFEQRDALRNSKVHVIEACGHAMVDDQPEEFFRVLLGYLKIR